MYDVAPARERGLKCKMVISGELSKEGRSRKGAWIEIDAGVFFGKRT